MPSVSAADGSSRTPLPHGCHGSPGAGAAVKSGSCSTAHSSMPIVSVSRAFEAIAVDSRGRIVVVWIDERARTASDRVAEVWMAVSCDHGKLFSQDRMIIRNVCECCRLALATDSSGAIYLRYRG